ncbi:MAG: hypothetical protein WCT19_03145 [Candidatus Paceibacterota bacterium]|jgi:hypothetical protein
MSLSDFAKKSKSKEVLAVLTIVLAGFGGFGLGRLSVTEGNRQPVAITYPDTENTAKTASVANSLPNTNSQTAGQLVASKNGTKYYFPWCSGVEKILEANKVWFDSEEKARAKGYTPAANCKGLK